MKGDKDELGGARARRNIALLGAAVIAGLWIVVGLLAWRDHRETLAAVDRDQKADAAVMRSYTYLLLDVARQVSRRLEDRIDRMSWDEIVEDELIQQTMEGLASGLNRQVASIHLIDAEGNLRVTSRLKKVPPGEDRSDRGYFRALKAGWTGAYVEHATGRIGGTPVMVIAFPLRELSGEFRGAALVSVATASLDAFFADVSGRSGDRKSVV